ncbi:DUF6624 domain-containing protein [Streptomyces scabiei]|uniref:DUF6624 domain-containing protein n=1 Tax=Streptomyces scabiei TaxID=1930 RepID=UPI0029A44BC8|nr:DUF6624 domain-containing protein [Streptomyces scabiei]MDX3523347.1 hypothetical protein [Streptomyces scabiei]
MRITTAPTTRTSGGPENRGLALELLRCMWRAQEAGTSVPRTNAASAVVSEMFAENSEVLRKIIAEHGWPGHSLVGERAAQAAWYIAQHCSDSALQDRALCLMEEAVHKADVNPEHYALLADRVCFNRRQSQRFGTLYVPDSDGRLVLYQVREAARLDDRRRALGLGPHGEYEAALNKWDARFNSRP